MRPVSLERELSINAMIAFTHEADGKPLPFEILIQRLNGLSKTVHMEGFALRLTRVLDELLDLQKENDALLGMMVEGLAVELTDDTVSLRMDSAIGEDRSWLELVDLKAPEAGRYGVYDNRVIENVVTDLQTAMDYGTPHEISQAVHRTIADLSTER